MVTLALLPNIKLGYEVFHPSLFARSISDEVTKFYNIDTRWPKRTASESGVWFHLWPMQWKRISC